MIRTGTIGDARGLTELLHAVEDLSQIAKESFETTLTRVQKHLEKIASNNEHSILVAEDKGQIVGYINTHWHPTFLHSNGEGYISELFIHPEFRSRNLGTLLTQKIIEEGKARGCARLCLLNFYAKQGWQERPNAANFIYNLKGNV
jgi:ribosomal protein S18 acetylase RimI-like enzyme